MLPLKINTDLDPATVPANSSRLNVNVNLDILKATITNEQGFDIVPLTTEQRDIVGSCLLPDNRLLVFSIIKNNLDYRCEIGVIKNDKYSVVLRDNVLENADFGFNTLHLIQAEAKVNFNGDEVAYWVDGYNSDKWLNIDNLQVKVTSDLKILDAGQLNLMLGFLPAISDLPDRSTSVLTTGNLETGVYYITITYGDSFNNFTKTALISSAIPIVESFGSFGTSFIGSKSGVSTNKSINLLLKESEINDNYNFIKINVISKINQVIKAYEFGIYTITSGDFNLIIDTLVDKTEVSLDSIIINNSNYKSSLSLTQLDDVLYKANLKERKKLDLQPYVNNIKTNYIQRQVDIRDSNPGSNFKDPNMCFYSKGFMYDEVYALYVSFTIEDNGEYETEAYHVPGREAAEINLGGLTSNPLENDFIKDVNTTDYMNGMYYINGSTLDMTPVSEIFKIDSDNSKIFHAVATNDNPLASTNMGYWENKDDKYDNNDKWLVKDSNGNVINDFRNQPIRHHKFPEAFNHSNPSTPNYPKSIHPDNSQYTKVNILGFQLSNLTLPDDILSKVKKINLYYAKRDINNRTILGQSLLQSLSQIHNYDNAGFNTSNTVWNNSGQFIGYNMGQSSGTRNAGIFPVGYSLTDIQSLGIPNMIGSTDKGRWAYSDSKGKQPDFWTKGYYKFKSFDLLQQKIDVKQATYIKNLYRVKSLYRTGAFNADLSDVNKDMITWTLFDPCSLDTSLGNNWYGGIDRISNNSENLFNLIRRLTNSDYVAQGFPNQRNAVTNSPYSFSGVPFNYGGEESIWLETDYYLYNWKNTANFNEQGNDFSYIDFQNNTTYSNSNNYSAYASPYISNLCVYKLNIFSSFEDQVLCLCDSINLANYYSGFQFYNGDTFTSIYADKGGVDASAYTPQGNPTPTDPNNRPLGQFRSIHCYIIQSTSNVNYRYEGDNSWETFYPYTNAVTMNSLAQTSPEWLGYSVDYSSVNDLKQPVISSNFENQFQTVFPNRVIRSATDNPELIQDNYLDYLAGDYKDFGKIKGEIRNITNQNNKLVIKTDNGLFVTLGREIIKTENAEANVTAGDIFAVKPREIVSSDSYGGGLGRFADCVTQYGYMYPDTTNGIVYNFNGENIDEISKAGKQIFFRNELKFKLPKKINKSVFDGFPVYDPLTNYQYSDYYVTYNSKVWSPKTTGILGAPGESQDWTEVDYVFKNIDSIIDGQSIGVQAIFDYKYRRYILTKKDYDYTGNLPNSYIGNLPDVFYVGAGNDDGKIVWSNGIFYKVYGVIYPELAPVNSVFLGKRPGEVFELYIYGIAINFKTDFFFNEERFTMAYYPEAQGWVSYYTFYPDAFMYNIDSVYSFTKEYNTKLYKHNSDTQNSFFYNREVPYSSFVEPILNEPKGVNRTSSFSIKANSYRKDGSLDYLRMFTKYFVRNSYQISNEVNVENTKTSRNAEGYFNINDFRDVTKDNSKPLMTDTIITEPDPTNINLNKHWSKQKKFVDYYIIPRLTNNPNFELVNMELSHVAGQSNISTAVVLEIGDIIKFIVGSTTYVYIITNATTYEYEVISTTEATGDFTVSSFYKLPTRELNLLDINTLNHKNTR